MSRTLMSASTLLVALLAPLGAAWAQTVPANFAQNDYASVSGGSVTSMAWAKDGADDLLFCTQKGGAIRVIKNGTPQGANVAGLTVTTNNEAGLDSIIVDPSYASNKFIYVFACEVAGAAWQHRIYRFTISNGATVGISAGPTPIGPVTPCMNVNHNGGGMAIGADGYLYMGTGNLGNGNNVGGDGTGTEWTSLGSKIIRIDRTTGAAVASNPWYSDATHTDPLMKYVFAKGFRNPFGLRMRPGTNDLWLTEVGDNWEQIFLVTAGSTQGYPTENNTSDNSKLKVKLAYPTNSETRTPIGPPPYYGGCLTRGAFYTGSMFPATYTNNFFFVDYNFGRVMRAVLNATNDGFSSSEIFVSGDSSLTDINTGPDGALYYCEIGGTIKRLVYTVSASQSLVVSTTSMTITEGGNGTFQVHLAIAPPGDVTVTVARSAGDADISVSGGASLTFTTGNWSVNQTVTIHAAEDADMINDTATITVSSASLTSKNVSVTATDNDAVTGAPTASITGPLNNATVSGTGVDFYGQGAPQGSATLDRAEFYVDGVLRYTDVYDPAVGHFHFDGEHLGWNTTAYSDGAHTLRMTVFDSGGLSGGAEITVTVNNASGATGLRGDYYSDMNLTNLVLSRVDPNVDFDWGTGAPDGILPSDGFSVRWTGQIVPTYTQMYTFYTYSDDGARLWVNGTLMVDQWVNQSPHEWSGSIALTAGTPATIVYEYYENTGGAVAQLSWSSSSQAKGVIGTSAMMTTHAGGTPAVLSSGGGGGGGGCGLLGLEGWILLGFAAGLKRRRR